MSSTIKILLGALVTAILAWFLHGPMGFGAKCAASGAGDNVAASAPADEPEAAATAPIAPASSEAVASCQAEVDSIAKGKSIQFVSGGSAIAPESRPLLDSLAASLAKCEGAMVEVAGHTDARGDAGANQRLSEARAQAVVKALTERKVPADRLKGVGYGETKLLDTGTTAEADAKNRRTAFTVSAASAAPAEPAAEATQ